VSQPHWIAIDWGTSNMRLWALDGADRVLAERRSDRGMGGLEPGEYEGVLLVTLEGLLPETGRLPVLICGMAGARQGWREAAYLPVPCAPAGAGAVRPPVRDARLDVAILPGLSQSEPPDVMRGEETQIAGFLAGQPEYNGVLCLPGTHSKWVRVSGGRVTAFRTAMTGEVFALLTERSVLRHSIGPGWDTAAFRAGVETALTAPHSLPLALFPLRAEALLGGLTGEAARARLSGLLIGAELASAREVRAQNEVVLIGDETLTGLYAEALLRDGIRARRVPAEDMTLRGLTAARKALEAGT